MIKQLVRWKPEGWLALWKGKKSSLYLDLYTNTNSSYRYSNGLYKDFPRLKSPTRNKHNAQQYPRNPHRLNRVNTPPTLPPGSRHTWRFEEVVDDFRNLRRRPIFALWQLALSYAAQPPADFRRWRRGWTARPGFAFRPLRC